MLLRQVRNALNACVTSSDESVMEWGREQVQMADLTLNDPTKSLLYTIADKELLSPCTIWNHVHRMISAGNIVDGAVIQFLNRCPLADLHLVVRHYREAVENCLYSADFKLREPGSGPTCPYSHLWLTDKKVAEVVIRELEVTYSKHYGAEWTENSIGTFDFRRVYADLLRITYQLEKTGHTGFVPFDQKWEEVKDWPTKRGVVGPLMIGEFLTPPKYRREVDFEVTDFMPREMRHRLYKDAFHYYNSVMDPSYYGDPLKGRSKIGPVAMLAESVLSAPDDTWDEDLREMVRPYHKG
jgi:hypothetical protein